MDGIIVQYLLGLYFSIAELPALFASPKTLQNIIKFICGIILLGLALFNVDLLVLIGR